jgi:diguanylate cyclase (GGDEF)-like protein
MVQVGPRGSLFSESLARTDSLTGLYGRRAFEDRLDHDLAVAQRHKTGLTLAYVDLDDFKAINDTRGHAEGDRVLRVVGRVLIGSVRETDTAARLGGDEFALVLPETDGDGAQQVIAKLKRDLDEALEIGTRRVTCSIGVVTFLGAVRSSEHAIAAAEELMYQVKHIGKGAVAFSVLSEVVEPRVAADAPQAPRH